MKKIFVWKVASKFEEIVFLFLLRMVVQNAFVLFFFFSRNCQVSLHFVYILQLEAQYLFWYTFKRVINCSWFLAMRDKISQI